MNLKILGFNKYEEKVYLSLIKLGEATSLEISKVSGVPYGRIYDTLNSLMNKGLVALVTKKPKKFIAIDPSIALDRRLNEKFLELKKIKEEIRELKKEYTKRTENVVFVLTGKINFHKVIFQKKPKKLIYSIKYDFNPHPVWMRTIRNILKRKVDVKTLGRVDNETYPNVKKWIDSVGDKIKKFPNKGVAIGIIDDERVIIGLIKSDTTVIINDRAFSDVMKNLFKAAWNTSEYVK